MTDPQRGEPSYPVPGLERGIRILQMFNSNRRSIAPPEIARELELPRTTVYRLVQALERLGLLERQEGGSFFRPGLAILSLGFECLASLDISELGRPVLDRLSEETGLASHLALRDGTDVVVVQKAQGRSPFASALQIGTRLPVHGTVLGRMSLVDMPESDLAALFDNDMPAFTKQTPTTVTALAAMLALDAKRGYAVSDSFFEQGISTIAAPVRDQTGLSVGAVNVTLRRAPSSDPDFDAIVANVLKAGEELSHSLRYHRALARDPMPNAG
ncbi:MAG: IclR family transcriptional regulator [Pseudomonadota bacterium]